MLTQIEFELLYILLSYPNIIFTPNQLIDDIWSFDSDITEDMIREYINRLKNNFKSCREFEIIVVKGNGYKSEIRINGCR